MNFFDKEKCDFCKYYIPFHEERHDEEYMELLIGYCDNPENSLASLNELVRADDRTACVRQELKMNSN